MTMSGGVMDGELKFQPSIMLLAQQGDCRAIAQWLNTYLAPQGISANVAIDRPRCLRVVVQFQHVPNQQRLVRFICHRLCKLNSRLFNSVRILAQYAGTALTLWEQTVRLATATAPRSPLAVPLAPEPPPSPLPPRLTLHALSTPPWRDASQLILFKNPLLLAAAMLAFVLGAGLDVVIDQSGDDGDLSRPRSVTLPAIHPSHRVTTPVGSVPVQVISDLHRPDDPDLTLMFSNPALLTASHAIPALREADVTLAHLDQPIQSTGRRSDRVASGQMTVEQLHQQGVDLVNVADERTVLRNRNAFANTLRSLNNANISVVGSGVNRRAARRPAIVEVKGKRIAYLGYANLEGAAQPWSMGINPALEEQIAEDIRTLREQVDWVVVTYHWGQNLADYPAEWQMRLAHFAVDQGADLVVGYHPTVLQGAEVYQGRAIAYSLGDFIYASGPSSTPNHSTAALKVSIRDQQMKLEFLPIQVRDTGPTLVQGHDGRAILRYIEQASGLFAQPMQSPLVLDQRDRSTPLMPDLETPSDSFTTFPDGSFTTFPDDGADAAGSSFLEEAEEAQPFTEPAPSEPRSRRVRRGSDGAERPAAFD